MTFEIQVFSKDLIKLNILQDVLGGMVNLAFQLNNGVAEDFATSIHKEGKRVQVYGKFNISEDPAGEVLTIRPIMIEGSLKILFQTNASFSGKKASVIRGSTKNVEQEYEISSETAYIEFVPQDKQSYLMKVENGNGAATTPIACDTPWTSRTSTVHASKPQPKSEIKLQQSSANFEEVVIPSNQESSIDERFQGFDLGTDFGTHDERFTSFDMNNDTVVSSPQKNITVKPAEEIETGNAINSNSIHPASKSLLEDAGDDDLRRIEQEIAVVERQQGQFSRKKQSAIDHLEKIEAEYKKDYASLEKDLDEIKSRMEADALVIEHYKDQDVMPIETIFQEIRLKLEEAEQQIRFFIEAKQRKTMEIENEIKSNKKQ